MSKKPEVKLLAWPKVTVIFQGPSKKKNKNKKAKRQNWETTVGNMAGCKMSSMVNWGFFLPALLKKEQEQPGFTNTPGVSLHPLLWSLG